ncbi:MAG: hypothetical protein ACTSPQ_07005 [Candidatus Helarchaeota archaeon]
MLKFNKKNLNLCGILGFLGLLMISVITFFRMNMGIYEIIIYDAFQVFFGALIVISFYLIGEKFGRNGVKISAICILDIMIMSLIREIIYNTNTPILYSLEYYNLLSFIYGINSINFIIAFINSVAFGLSVFGIGSDFSNRILQITAVLWFADIIISFFLLSFTYLIIFRWALYGITAFSTWILAKIDLKSVKKKDEKIRIKVGFGKR